MLGGTLTPSDRICSVGTPNRSWGAFPAPLRGRGGAGGEFSKGLGLYLKRIELKKTGLVFHPFRHAFADALREVSAPGYVVKDLLTSPVAMEQNHHGHRATLG